MLLAEHLSLCYQTQVLTLATCLLGVRGASHIALSSSSLEAPPSITVVQAPCKCAPFRDQDHAPVPLGGLVAGWVILGRMYVDNILS